MLIYPQLICLVSCQYIEHPYEEYSKLRGKLRKCKRERESLEAEIETLKQRNEDLAKIVGNFGNHEDPLLNKDLMPESAEAGELAATANEPNSTSRDRHHQQSLMAEVQKLKVQEQLLNVTYIL